MSFQEKLRSAKDSILSGEEFQISVREFLSWFGAQRRGTGVVSKIRESLSEFGIQTEPDFESAYIDSEITFLSSADAQQLTQSTDQRLQVDNLTVATSISDPGISTSTTPLKFSDPAHRISKLAAANRAPTYIAPDAELNEAVTKMLLNDFSQLPVMTNERDVKGAISWQTIATRLTLGRGGEFVRDFMESPKEIASDASLFQAIPIISEHHYVLVRAKDKKISGIVTATDLSLQFRQLSEPFLLLSEIENHIRSIIGSKLTVDELGSAKDPADTERKIESVHDLTFGEYIKLMENPSIWDKLKLSISRTEFCTNLDKIRTIRNDVMHFDPDGVPSDDLRTLQGFSGFLHQLRGIGAI